MTLDQSLDSSQEDITAKNNESLNSLARAIQMSQGEYSPILVCCNYTSLRQHMMQQLRQQCSVEIQEMALPKYTETLYQAIEAQLGDKQTSALIVFGFESVIELDKILISLKQDREKLAYTFSFPVVLWLTEPVLSKLVSLARDFVSCSLSPIEFEMATDELRDSIKSKADHVFEKILKIGAGILQEQGIFNGGNSFPSRSELELARKQLTNQGVSLEPELEASLEFLLGSSPDSSLEERRQHYERSLELWQQTSNLERQGCVMYYLGLWWFRDALGYRFKRDMAFTKAKDYYQQCVEVFKQTERSEELEQKFINALAEGCKRIKKWNELEPVAQRAKDLHESCNDQLRLARAYGFLAEVALNQPQPDPNQAQKLAEKARSIFRDTEADPSSKEKYPADWLEWQRSFHYGWYLLPLAQAQKHLGQIKQAIKTLEEARTAAKPEYDPELYINILEELIKNYSQEREYFEAFQIKQQQRSIEQQFGFRAFIGASPLQPEQLVINPILLPINLQQIAITVSGRQQYVNDLITQLTKPSCKLIVIHGPSGVGKSSLLRAKLIPALKQKLIGFRDVLPIYLADYNEHWFENLGQSLPEELETRKIDISQALDPTAAILKQLKQNDQNNLLTILIFDKFEDFFYICRKKEDREIFANFLKEVFSIRFPFVKVILSLREDYLSYLLELNRLTDLGAMGNNILDKNILYYLGNFSPEQAQIDIEILTKNTYLMKADLITQLVEDLTDISGEVSPIELQLVGAQLETKNISDLAGYRKLSDLGINPKNSLIENYLEEVVQDCGEENEKLAYLVFYLLTDHNNTCPLKSRTELVEGLDSAGLRSTVNQLNLVLDILVASGLVTRRLEIDSSPNYQLAHDYLVAFIRMIFTRDYSDLLSKLTRTKDQLRKDLAIEKIKKLNSDSQALFFKHEQLKALKSTIKAGEEIQKIKDLPEGVIKETEGTLKQVVYAIAESKSLNEHESDVYSLSFSSDSKLLASASWDTTIKIWNSDNGKLLTTIPGHYDCINSVKFSPDGQLLASASADYNIKLWRLLWSSNGKKLTVQELQPLGKHDDWVWDICFSPNGQMLASASGDCTIKLWDLEGKLLKCLKGHQARSYSVHFSPNGQTLVSGSEDHTIKLWDVSSGTCLTLDGKDGHKSPVKSVRFSPDGKILISASEDHTVKLWSVKDYTLIRTLEGHSEWVNSVAFRGDGKVLASGSNDNTVKLWSLDGDLLKTLRGHSDWVRYVEFSPNDQILASASDDNTIKVWKLDFIVPANLKVHIDKVHSVCFSRDGKTLASAGWDKQIRVWSFKNGSWDNTLVISNADNYDWIWEVSFNPDGQTLASGGGDCTIKLWNLKGKLIKTFPKEHNECIHSARFSPDGKYLASASGDKTVKLWDVERETLLATCKGHIDKVWGVSFSPDSTIVASASGDKTTKLWNLNGECLETFDGKDGHSEWINDVVFSPNGKTLASASNDTTLKLWDLEGNCLQTFEGHNAKVYDVSFHPDGQFIASASADKTIKIWGIDGTLLKTLEGHGDWVNSVMFSPDGKFIASASNDTTVKVWDLSQIELKSLSFEELLERGRKWLSKILVSD
jgi:WD40 repeat protein/tetratricopeptide (TPR) repeat protein